MHHHLHLNRVAQLLGAVLLLTATVALAQPGAFPMVRRGMRMPRGMPGPAAHSVAAPGEDTDTSYADGPGLKNDSEAQQLLSRAEQFANEGRFDLAAVLWQKVLDDSGDSLVSIDGRLYISLRRQVEQKLAALSDLGLSTYRVTADGEAQSLLSAAAGDKEVEALATIVRRYFISSIGDDAAYRLGCLALDQYDFLGASRMFSKILEEHPDPSMPRGDVLLRLAAASGRVGDREGAVKLLASIDTARGSRPARSLVALVETDIASAARVPLSPAAQITPRLPEQVTEKTLTESWSHGYDLLFSEQSFNPMMYGYGGPARKTEKIQISREQLIQRWKANGWIPAGKLLLDGDLIYFKTRNNILCWENGPTPSLKWESLWNNEFEIDEFSQHLAVTSMNMQQQGVPADSRPRTPAEIFLFGDRIQQDFSLAGGMLYSIEGRRSFKQGPAEVVARQPKQINWNTTPRRTRVNFLTAYDAITGKLKWHRGADDSAKDAGEGSMGFMAAPVACGQSLLVPITDGGTMWLYGLSPSDGKTLWKTYLCDEPTAGCDAWSPIAVAVQGRDAYVLGGAGVVFALDGTNGAVRWAVRYHRDEDSLNSRQVPNPHGGMSKTKQFNGWAQDLLLATGRQLVVMGSDSKWMFSLDTRSGDVLWKSPRAPSTASGAAYMLGVQGRSLFVAGEKTVRRVDLIGGKIMWEKEIEPSFGRGLLTEDALYIPVKDSIVKFDLEKGRELAQVGVRLTTDDPVGNLYSDGKQLWMLAANRITSLTHLELRMRQLGQSVEAGDSNAMLERMRLYAKNGQWPEAIEDLVAAHTRIAATQDGSVAAMAVLTAIDELKLARQQPVYALDALALVFTGKLDGVAPASQVKLQSTLGVCLSALPRTKTEMVANSIIGVAPLLRESYLVDTAGRVLKVVATDSDRDLLRAAVIDRHEPAALIAAEAWAMLDPSFAQEELRGWLGSDLEGKQKLRVARALLQTGDATAIDSLLSLLESDDSQLRQQSYYVIRGATGKADLPFVSYASPEERSAQVQGWRTWWHANQSNLKLALPLNDTVAQLGRTLICSHSRASVVEVDSSGKELSRRSVPQPWSAVGLPNGNRLVASTAQNHVTEYDERWNERWKFTELPSGAWSIDRTASGSTIVACADASLVVEISPNKEKTVVWQSAANGRPVFAKRLENGNLLICLQSLNKVIEVKPDGTQVWEAANLINPFSAQRLENGSTLIAAMMNGNNGSIVEVDPSGNARVVKDGLRQVYAAQRLENGNLLYADGQGLHELDESGKNVWSRREIGITGFSRF